MLIKIFIILCYLSFFYQLLHKLFILIDVVNISFLPKLDENFD